MKAGLAVALFVVTLLREHAVDLRGRLTLAFASDEETGGRWGTEWLLANVDDVVRRFKDEEQRRTIVEQAYDYVLSEHTYRHRVAALLAAIGVDTTE